MRLKVFYPNYSSGRAISHICLSLCEAMRGEGMDVDVTMPASDAAGRREFTRDAVPSWIKRLVYRLDRSERRVRDFAARRYLAGLERGDVAYVWPGAPLWVYEEIKRRGQVLVMERINTHQATAKRILDAEFRRLGMPSTHGITDEAVELERRALALADLVFSPSPLVEESLVEHGVARDRVIASSYGWDPSRIDAHARASLRPIDGLTVVFAGRVCVRKGPHLLLEAWAASGVKGRVVFAGKVDQDVAERNAAFLARADVTCLSYVSDIGGVYRSADVFAFPTLEEGSPLVTYEAMACGLPVVVSPMGAGGVAREGKDGLIIDGHEREAWAGALRRLAADAELRRGMGESARIRAQGFTWSEVGARRRRALLEALARLAAPHAGSNGAAPLGGGDGQRVAGLV
ncbi:MAG: glycosyltransferase family 4 protein [Phycisphaerae bacterium]|nr:glycosyltransferase family 4 protein [Phycisphaerae bacterium]